MAAPHHQILLSNPFALDDTDGDEDDSSLDSSQPHTPTTTHPSSGLRAQLNHLLPRHAFFHVSIRIHQITNIPLVSGEFAIKWKFKNAHNASGQKSGSGLFGGFKARRKARREEKESRLRQEYTGLGEPGDSRSNRGNSFDGQASVWSRSTKTTSSSSSSSSSKAPHSKSTFTTSSSTSSMPTLPASVSAPTTLGRGQTPFLRLKDHGVTWDYTLSLVVRMDVDRDPMSMLLPCPLKLTVLQRDSTHHDAKLVPFGIVMLDLAQYASKGEVERRYLLRESKTNATLKLTTYLTHVPSTNASSSVPQPIATASTSTSTSTGTGTSSTSGQTANSTSASTTTNTFTAPPLPKGEILNGISSILEGASLVYGSEGDKYHVRPKGLDLYGPYYDQEELEFDLLGGRFAPKINEKGKRKVSKGKGDKGKGADKDATPTPITAPTPTPSLPPVRTRERSDTQSFDPSKLPLAYGTRTTEALIEALFNPVPTRYKEKENPFTMYIPDLPMYEGMPKRPGATPVQRVPSDTPTSYIDTSPAPSSLNTSPRSSKSGPVVSPPVSFSGSKASSGSSPSSTSPSSPLGSAQPSNDFTPPVICEIPASPSPNQSESDNITPVLRSTLTLLSSTSTTSTATTIKPSKSSSPKGRTRPNRAGSTGIGAGLGIMGLGMGMGVGMGVGVGVSGAPRRTSVDGSREAFVGDERKREERGAQKEEKEGVKAWLRRAKGSSRPSTPTTPVNPVGAA